MTLAMHAPGSTDTSLWTHYSAGEREYCGNSFPDGMRKNARLENNVITPTTKAASHDVPISAAEIVRQGLMTPEEWDEVGRLECVEKSRCSCGRAQAWIAPCASGTGAMCRAAGPQ